MDISLFPLRPRDPGRWARTYVFKLRSAVYTAILPLLAHRAFESVEYEHNETFVGSVP